MPIPYKEPSKGPATMATFGIGAPDDQQLRDAVLVVEDNQGTRETLTAYLKLEGYVVHAAENGDRALELLRVTAPSVLVVDLRMPGMDGAALRNAQCSLGLSTIPFILMTAAPEGPRMATELAADGVIAN